MEEVSELLYVALLDQLGCRLIDLKISHVAVFGTIDKDKDGHLDGLFFNVYNFRVVVGVQVFLNLGVLNV